MQSNFELRADDLSPSSERTPGPLRILQALAQGRIQDRLSIRRAGPIRGWRLGRQAQLPVHPDFVAIDPSIRPVDRPSDGGSDVARFPRADRTGGRAEEDESIAAFWAY
jgi:hypothetical protein